METKEEHKMLIKELNLYFQKLVSGELHALYGEVWNIKREVPSTWYMLGPYRQPRVMSVNRMASDHQNNPQNCGRNKMRWCKASNMDHLDGIQEAQQKTEPTVQWKQKRKIRY